MCVYMCVCMCVWGGGGNSGGLVVGTPVYNTSGCEIDLSPTTARPSHHPPVHPAVKWVPSLYKTRVDKTTTCGGHNILTSGGLGGA